MWGYLQTSVKLHLRLMVRIRYRSALLSIRYQRYKKIFLLVGIETHLKTCKGLLIKEPSTELTLTSNNTIIGNVISPIFVLSDNIFNNLSDIKFKCVDGNIIPSKDDNIPNDIFSYNKIGKSLPISQQISMCNQSIKKGEPLSIVETIRKISNDKKKLNYKLI